MYFSDHYSFQGSGSLYISLASDKVINFNENVNIHFFNPLVGWEEGCSNFHHEQRSKVLDFIFG